MEKSKRSEATLTVRMNHEDDHGMNGDANLSQCAYISTRKTVQGQRHLLTTKERDYENEGSSMQDGSCIGINYTHRFPKCFRSLHTLLGFSLCTSCRQFNCKSCTAASSWGFRSALRVTYSIVVAVPLSAKSDLYANSL